MGVLDQFVRGWIVHHRIQALDPIMLVLTLIGGGGGVWIAVAFVWAWIRRINWTGCVRVALAIVVTTGVADLLVKPSVERPRPFVVLKDVPVLGRAPEDSSFPSGHAADAVAGVLTLSRVAVGASGWWLLAAGIAYSRVYLGVHYPSDVAGGMILGFLCATVTNWGIDWLVWRRAARGTQDVHR